MRTLAILSIAILTACGRLLMAADSPSAQPTGANSAAEWPPITQTARPWTRWWWHGSAVNEENLTRCLESYRVAGLGGVEITCIYGVQGEERRDIPYLSDRWIEVVSHAIKEAKRLDMGVDLPPGSGWRIGGPTVQPNDGNAEMVLEKVKVASGETFNKNFSSRRPQAVVAYGPNNEVFDLTSSVDAGRSLSWKAPLNGGSWTVYALTMKLTREKVKRAAPGGEGLNINPYSRAPLEHYLRAFAQHFDRLQSKGVRASFHDSFEYEGSWCGEFLAEFRKRRGYRLEDHLPALAGDSGIEEVAQIKCDYRETIFDLLRSNLIEPWAAWAHARGQLARNQAHGSPGNWLDLYAAADIPETESFGRQNSSADRRLLFKFASSSAHVAGHSLVSSETGTWLDEHFNVTLGQLRETIDQQFLAGVNHTIYHGTAYSPRDAAWPGWQFYASTELNPQNPIWRDFPALNSYVARCQSVLQSGNQDNDILLYWPIHDVWHHASGLRENLTIHNADKWFFNTPFGRAAAWLDEHGYAFDYVSDRLLSTCKVHDSSVVSRGASYKLIIVPAATHMPATTLDTLRALAVYGATIAFVKSLPVAPPGFPQKDQETQFQKAHSAFEKSLGQTSFHEAVDAPLGKGRVIAADTVAQLVRAAALRQETCRANAKIDFIRLIDGPHAIYFLKNESDEKFDGPLQFSARLSLAFVLDPITGRIGKAPVRDGNTIRLQLEPRESVFVRSVPPGYEAAPWKYRDVISKPVAIDGKWKLEFLSGGPELPPPAEIHRLATWTSLSNEAERFAGTAAYSIKFSAPGESSKPVLLDLGVVRDSARVFLNGKEIGTLIDNPFQIVIGPLRSVDNDLRVEVTNVAANRIRDMDRRGVRWRIFRDINFVNINYKPFDASNWPVREAGLIGPVTIQPLN